MAIATNSGKEKYRKPRTGEKRAHRMPLRIDGFPADVKAVIVESRAAGLSWSKTAEAASAKAGKHLAATTVQRWHDLRIEQPQNNVSAIVPLLREIIDLLRSRLPAVSQ
jgi:hypothetical protein